jgi:hypothetical protein
LTGKYLEIFLLFLILIFVGEIYEVISILPRKSTIISNPIPQEVLKACLVSFLAETKLKQPAADKKVQTSG